jgi:XTP/dITP diphosphohydrolase
MADDSGLEVDALDGDPGIYSARYAGEPSDDAANNRKLLVALDGVTNRSSRFRCVIAIVEPNGVPQTVDGRCEGKIGFELQGENGFGYDPLFTPDGHEKTFAQLGYTIKNKISHRAVALNAIKKQLIGMVCTTSK